MNIGIRNHQKAIMIFPFNDPVHAKAVGFPIKNAVMFWTVDIENPINK